LRSPQCNTTIPTAPCGLPFTSFRPRVLRAPAGKSLLWACAVAGLAGVVYYWPTMPGFWHKDIWWVEETAREGMGMMIAFAVLVVVLFSAHRKPAPRS